MHHSKSMKETPEKDQPILISPSKIAAVLMGTMCVLVIGHVTLQTLKYWGGYGQVYGLTRLLDARDETSIVTLFSSLLLLASSLLLAVIAIFKARKADSYARHWKYLALIFLYLAVDEGSEIHGLLNRPVGAVWETGGVLLYSWVIPYSILIIFFGLAYLKFLMHLNPRFRRLFLAAGIIYVSGAFGMEMICGWYHDHYGWDNLSYNLLATVEETLEMTGAIVFIYSLLTYIGAQIRDVRVRVAATQAEASLQPAESQRLPAFLAAGMSKGEETSVDRFPNTSKQHDY